MPKHKYRTPPPIGSVYDRRYKGVRARMTVVESADSAAYRVGDRDYKTPSAAAKSITGAEVNGWKFWRID